MRNIREFTLMLLGAAGLVGLFLGVMWLLPVAPNGGCRTTPWTDAQKMSNTPPTAHGSWFSPDVECW